MEECTGHHASRRTGSGWSGVLAIMLVVGLRVDEVMGYQSRWL